MRKTIIYLFLFIALGLAGCGFGKKATRDLFENSLTVNDDNSFTEVIRDTFDKDYYSIEELQDMIHADIEGKNIKLVSVDLREEDGAVAAVLQYDSVSDFNDYNESDIFYGTLNEAFFAGKIKQNSLVDVKKNNTVSIDSEFIEKNGDLKIIITKDNMNLYTFGDVLFYDNNASYDKKNKMVSFKESNQKHIIIFK